jgi:hypothetical protein
MARCEVPTGFELVCLSGQTGNDPCMVRKTRFDPMATSPSADRSSASREAEVPLRRSAKCVTV